VTVRRGELHDRWLPPGTVTPPVIEPLTELALVALRSDQVDGISRRQLLRRSLGAAIGLVVTEWLGGTIGFLWPTGEGAGGRFRVGTFADVVRSAGGLPVERGVPAYLPEAHAFVVLRDPAIREFLPGGDGTGTGEGVNVLALSQRCPHLGCRPNPCLEDFWFHCPCHQSRYDRLGIKAAGEAYGPAPRGMDRFPVEVDERGVLTIDTSRVIMGPLPVALGQPGLIPPLVPRGCLV
jgi:cytochrome b6-f complex iron-sulfur subunit